MTRDYDDAADIIALFNQGWNTAEIAGFFVIPEAEVYRVLALYRDTKYELNHPKHPIAAISQPTLGSHQSRRNA